MEQRRAPRFNVDQSVVVTVLGSEESRLPAIVRNASGRGLAIEMPLPVSPGTALQIELDDSIVLGEAVYCHGGTPPYLIGVELDQVLCGLTELGRKLQEFAAEERLRSPAAVQ